MLETVETTESLCISPDQPLSWSFFRHTLFKKCKRAYFYHYYGAQGGWDNFADTYSRQIHKLKSIKTVELWVEDVFKRSLRELFIAPHNSSDSRALKKQLSSIIYKHAKREHREYRAHEWDDDHQKLNIFEEYYNETTNDTQLKERALAKLESAIELFCTSA